MAQTSPPSTSPLASSTVTPHSRIPSSIAQSSDDGPRSPFGPGCTIRQRCVVQIDSGIIVLSIGQTISSGRCALDRRLDRGGRVHDRDGDLVAELGQRDQRALAEAVVRRREEEDPQRSRTHVGRVAAPDLAPHRSEPTAVTLILLTHRTSHHIAPKAIESTFRRRHRGPHSFL